MAPAGSEPALRIVRVRRRGCRAEINATHNRQRNTFGATRVASRCLTSSRKTEHEQHGSHRGHHRRRGDRYPREQLCDGRSRLSRLRGGVQQQGQRLLGRRHHLGAAADRLHGARRRDRQHPGCGRGQVLARCRPSEGRRLQVHLVRPDLADRQAVGPHHQAGDGAARQPDRPRSHRALQERLELGRHAGPDRRLLRRLCQGAGAARSWRGAAGRAFVGAVADRRCSARRRRCICRTSPRTPTAAASSA